MLVSVKVLWGFWDRDLTTGDTASYFLHAVRWSKTGQVDIVWSPLYTSYFGVLDWLFPDARVSVLLHRVVLVIVTTWLAAWSARRFLNPAVAFIVALWWVALPIHYDTLYEVHLFGAIVTIGAVAVCSLRRAWRLPLLVALYGVATILLRNENVVCFGILSAYLVYRLVQMARADSNGVALRSMLVRVAILATLGVGLVTYFYQMSVEKGWDQISAKAAPKHRLNMCQVYAFGYQQRHPEWTHSPWTECRPLMQRVFDSEMPSISEMLMANPDATLEHFRWNLSLAPAGFQVLFFNATSATVNPDYVPVPQGRMYPSVLSVLVVAVLLAAAIVLYRRRTRPFVFAARERDIDFAVLLAANVLMVLLIIVTQRPRPSYLLGFGFICAVAFGRLIETAWPRWRGLSGRSLAWLVAGAILVMPSYRSLYPSKYGRLSELYGMLKAQSEAICVPDSTIAIGEYSYDLRNYVCRSSTPAQIYLGSLPGVTRMGSLELAAAVRERSVHAVIFDRVFLQSGTKVASCAELDAALQTDGWKKLVFAAHPSGLCDAAYVKADAPPR